MFFKRKPVVTTEFEVAGVRCSHCEAAIKIALRDLPGVQSVHIQEKKRVRCSIDASAFTSPVDMTRVLTEIGYLPTSPVIFRQP